MDFVNSNIDMTTDPKAGLVFEKVKEKIVVHENFIEERLKIISPEIEQLKAGKYPYTIIDCPLCFQDSLILRGDSCECLFCISTLNWEMAMEKWLILHEGYYRYYDKDRLEDPLVIECPECEFESLYRFEFGDAHPPDPAAICFHCGASFLFCEWCSLSDVCPNDEDGFCKECSTYLEHRKRNEKENEQ